MAGFTPVPLAFQPGLFANRSKRASQQRWVDGNLIRFRDGVPEQVGGWQALVPQGPAITGAARATLSWRPNNQNGRYAVFGSETGIRRYDADQLADVTPLGFVAGQGSTVLGPGFGTDRYGADEFGTPRETTGNYIDASSWTFDLFGDLALGCFNADGVIYEYAVATDPRFKPVLDAPSASCICVSNERHVFAFSANGDAGKVKWSDRENRNAWTPSATNRAGGYSLQVRSPFQCGRNVRGNVIGWTKNEVYEFSPLANAYVYDQERISTTAGAVGPQAVAVVTESVGETAYWMGRNEFFSYDGIVRALPCELQDYVFKDINRLQMVKVCAAINAANKEVWFFYPSAAAEENDRCVIYNYVNGTWSKGILSRSGWMDAGVFANPIAVAPNGSLFTHEVGDTAAGAVMPSYVRSHPLTIGTGSRLADVSEFWPNFQQGSADCTVEFIIRMASDAEEETFGPFPLTAGQEFVPLGFSGREVDIKVNGAGGWWELGLPVLTMKGGSLQ